MNILVNKAKNKDPDAFMALIDTQMQSMYKVAKAHLKNDDDIADAIQDTILTCYEKIDTLKQNRYFKTWLIRILTNKCNDIIRKKKAVNYMEETPEIAVWSQEYTNIEWNQLLSMMDEKYRIILLLYYVEGFKVREIAQILEMQESTIRTRLARGREIMSQKYTGKLRRVDV